MTAQHKCIVAYRNKAAPASLTIINSRQEAVDIVKQHPRIQRTRPIPDERTRIHNQPALSLPQATYTTNMSSTPRPSTPHTPTALDALAAALHIKEAHVAARAALQDLQRQAVLRLPAPLLRTRQDPDATDLAARALVRHVDACLEVHDPAALDDLVDCVAAVAFRVRAAARDMRARGRGDLRWFPKRVDRVLGLAWVLLLLGAERGDDEEAWACAFQDALEFLQTGF
ncbi:hypothetical protein F4780DRAFT_792578 [Xylariomycetidae sp. FL0641]|nr:hypothetical protein F4780DRAFT_792578 [Xylariomycetidae sp. FL0641]